MTTRDDLCKALAAGTPGPWTRSRWNVLNDEHDDVAACEHEPDAALICLAVNLAPDLLASEAALRAERDAAVAREYAAHVVAQGYALGLLGDANSPEGSSDAARGVYVAAKKVVDERNAAVARLPDGMKHCTIQFHECALGHGWLTATNWVQHGCPTCEAATLRASLAAVTAERDFHERVRNELYEDVTRLDAELFAANAQRAERAERERDHLQARCEAEGAARMRVEEALRNARPIVDAVASIGPADLFPETLAAARPACDAIDAALGKKPCPGFPLGDGNFSGCNAAETGATDCPICGIDAALETKP